MKPNPPKDTASYRKYAVMQFRRLELLAAGEESSPDIERLEDSMTLLWDDFDDDQRRSLNGMASDLNWLRRKGKPAPKARKESDVSEEELRELDKAQNDEDWHATLHLLRLCASAIPHDLVAYARATCYYKLDFPAISVAFADLTIELADANRPVGRIAFEALMRLDPKTAFHRSDSVVSSPAHYSPVVVVLGIAYMFDTLGRVTLEPHFGRHAAAIREASGRLEISSASASDRALFYQLAGSEMQMFGESAEASDLYQKGLQFQPDNPTMLAGLGMAVYENDPDWAVTLFQAAIKAKATFARPYLHLAHYYLVRKEFNAAYGYGLRALELAREDGAKAASLDIMAISASEAGFDADVALMLFEEAAKYAKGTPLEDRINRNLRTIKEKMSGSGPEPVWAYDEPGVEFERNEMGLKTGYGEAAFA